MKRLLTLAAVMGLMAYGIAGARAQELLSNANLEINGGNGITPPVISSWTYTQSSNPATATFDAADLEGFAAHTGNSGVWLREFEGLFFPGTFPNTSTVSAVLSQTVAATAGQTYTFSGWAKWEQNYSGGVTTLAPTSPSGAVAPSTKTHLVLSFLNASNTVLATNTLDLKTVMVNGADWTQHSVSGLAPAGTTKVKVTAEALDMIANIDPGQSGFFDDFSLRAGQVPEPASVALGAMGLLGLARVARRRK